MDEDNNAYNVVDVESRLGDGTVGDVTAIMCVVVVSPEDNVIRTVDEVDAVPTDSFP